MRSPRALSSCVSPEGSGGCSSSKVAALQPAVFVAQMPMKPEHLTRANTLLLA